MIRSSRTRPSRSSSIPPTTNHAFVSPASGWEIAIKISMGKYKLNAPFEQFIEAAIRDNGFSVVPIEVKHCNILTTLPFHHRDPFDRMLIAQAMVENMSIVGNDLAFDAYGIARLW